MPKKTEQFKKQKQKKITSLTSESQSLPAVQISLTPAPRMNLDTRFHSASFSNDTLKGKLTFLI